MAGRALWTNSTKKLIGGCYTKRAWIRARSAGSVSAGIRGGGRRLYVAPVLPVLLQIGFITLRYFQHSIFAALMKTGFGRAMTGLRRTIHSQASSVIATNFIES
jgi:hypothetical protein